jgi:hypothetical protein
MNLIKEQLNEIEAILEQIMKELAHLSKDDIYYQLSDALEILVALEDTICPQLLSSSNSEDENETTSNY